MTAAPAMNQTAEDCRRAAVEVILLELRPTLDADTLAAIMARLDPKTHRATIEQQDALDPGAELIALWKALESGAWWYLRAKAFHRDITLPPANDLLPLLVEISRGRAFTRQHGYIERKTAESISLVLANVYRELTGEMPEPTRSLRKPWPRLIKAALDWAQLQNWQDRCREAALELELVFNRARITAKKRP
jgi:hypothetical protein